MKICETKAWKIKKKSLKFWVSLFFFFYLEPPPEPPMSCKYGFEDGEK